MKYGSRTQIIKKCSKNSKPWNEFKQMTLKENLEINTNEKEFKKRFLTIGDGIYSSNFATMPLVAKSD